jgi:hypothetical protein
MSEEFKKEICRMVEEEKDSEKLQMIYRIIKRYLEK